eukprot:2874509-Rhodomonas_salina.1
MRVCFVRCGGDECGGGGECDGGGECGGGGEGGGGECGAEGVTGGIREYMRTVGFPLHESGFAGAAPAR